MPIRRREGNQPDRRIAPADFTSASIRNALSERLRYAGSSNHKLRPGDYGFIPTHNPRPLKSPCDELRSILLEEATTLFRQGISLGMVSTFAEDSIPKYVWAVDYAGEVYEAKTKPERSTDYHGYRLGDDERAMRRYALLEWRRRCP